MPFKAPHVSFVSFAVEVTPSGSTQVMILETDLHLNPKHPAYNHAAIEHLIASAQNYIQDTMDGPVHIRIVTTRSGEV
jgi:hypothetical protein